MAIALTDLTALEKEAERSAAGQRSKVAREQWMRGLANLQTTYNQLIALRTEIQENGGSATGADIYTASDLADLNTAGSDLLDELVAFANTLPGVTASRS